MRFSMLDVKIFNDSNESDAVIKKIIARVGEGYGASIEIFYAPENEAAVGIPPMSPDISIRYSGRASLKIDADGFSCGRIRDALETLKSVGLINEAFVRQISDNFPDGHGGIRPLHNDLLVKTTLESELLFAEKYLNTCGLTSLKEDNYVLVEASHLSFFTHQSHSRTGINPHLSIEKAQSPYEKKSQILTPPDEHIPYEYKCSIS